MTSPIAAIGAIGNLASISSVAPTQPVAATAATGATSGASFASVLGQGLDAVSNTQATADQLAVQAATGQLADPAAYTVAATQANLMTQLATTLESKGVAAFNQIMSMQA